MPYVTRDMEERNLKIFFRTFYYTAEVQGRLAYFIMSFYRVNSGWFRSFIKIDITNILYVNMAYGFTFLIFRRPSMRVITSYHRSVFSFLGSLMFTNSSLLFYDWLAEKLVDRPQLLTIFAFVGGRLMLAHLLVYLYHIDAQLFITRHMASRNQEIDSIYRQDA